MCIRDSDYSLANSGATPKTVVFSINANRSIELAGHDMDLTLGYTNTDAQDVHPMASSVAYTNANENLVTLNPNDPSPARSNWEIEHRFVSTLNFMLADKTNVSLFYQLASGNPYSLSSYGDTASYACQLNMQPCWRAGDFPSIPLVIGENTQYTDSAAGMRNLDEGVYLSLIHI